MPPIVVDSGSTNKPPTYRDLDFDMPLLTSNSNAIGVKLNSTDIIQSIKNIILSSTGEVPFTANRIGLFEKRFDTLAPIHKDLLESDIRLLVNSLERRVSINDVQVNQAQGSSLLEVNISTTTLTTPRVERDIRIILNNTKIEA